MKTLLRILVDLCLLRGGPQNIPYSPGLTRALVMLGLGLDLLFITLVDSGDSGLARLALSLLLLLGLPWILLSLRQRQPRYAQTLAALAGTGVLFTLAFLPVALLAADMPVPDPEMPPSRQQLAVGWITLALVGWKIAINGNIWRHALEWPKVAGLLLAVACFVFELGLVQALFSVTA